MRDLAAGRLFTVGAARPGGTSRENVAVAVSATSTPDRSASRPLIRIVQEVPGGDRKSRRCTGGGPSGRCEASVEFLASPWLQPVPPSPEGSVIACVTAAGAPSTRFGRTLVCVDAG